MAKVLVTGGAGFVGRHCVGRLLARGDEVHCVDPVIPLTGGLPPEKWPFFDPRDYKNFNFCREDCRAWFKRVQDTDFDYAFHLAAMVGGRMMIEHNPLAVADDLSIDAEYWQWAVRAKPRKTLCFSSSAAYPIKFQRREHHVLLKEDMIAFDFDIGMPDMSYGWAKLTCEYLARLAHQKHGLKSVCYRPFSGYGEDQDMTYPFPAILMRAVRGQRPVTVWGMVPSTTLTRTRLLCAARVAFSTAPGTSFALPKPNPTAPSRLPLMTRALKWNRLPPFITLAVRLMPFSTMRSSRAI